MLFAHFSAVLFCALHCHVEVLIPFVDGAGGRSSARNNGAMLVDNDDDALEQDESPAKPAARPSGNRGRRALVEDSSDDEMADAQPLPAATTAAGERRCALDPAWVAAFARRSQR